MITLDYQDRRPLYEQVEEKLRHLIIKRSTGAWLQDAICTAARYGAFPSIPIPFRERMHSWREKA